MPVNDDNDRVALRASDAMAELDEAEHNDEREAETESLSPSASRPQLGQDLDIGQNRNDKSKKKTVTGVMAMLRDLDIKSASKEASRNKCNYLIGLFACWLAVTVVAVVHSGYEYTPLFFLSIAEFNEGEIDIQVEAGSWTNQPFLNFSKVQAEIGIERDFNYSSPRHDNPIRIWTTSKCDVEFDPSDIQQRYGKAEDDCSSFRYSTDKCCVCKHCGASTNARLFIIDSEKEERMDLGKFWPYPPIPKNQIYLQAQVAKRMEVTEGDEVIVQVVMEEYIRSIADGTTVLRLGDPGSRESMASSTHFLVLKVGRIFEEPFGKLDSEEKQAVFIEYNHFFNSLAQNALPTVPGVQESLDRTDAYEFAEYILFNFPQPRVDAYMSNNYDVVKRRVLLFVTRLVTRLGIQNVYARIMLLRALNDLRLFSLFLALIISIIMVGLCALLCLLIYSLLIVSVETRTFDLGVLRMVGMTRSGVIRLLLIQTLICSIPAWGLGLVSAHFIGGWVLGYLSELTGAKINPQLQPTSIAYASIMGLVVPMVSAVLPIAKALSSTLNDALDANRNKVVAVEISIERADTTGPPKAILAGGLVAAGLGFLIYYVFPRALLEFNLTLLLYIFFGLLMAMIGGLTLLSLNLERPTEYIVATLFFWWNPSSVKNMVHKNLTAHRKRNRKTTLMYALSLAFIIFVIKTFELQIVTFQIQEEQRLGTEYRITCNAVSSFRYSYKIVEDFIEEEPLIEDVGYISHRLKKLRGSDTSVSTLGKVYRRSVHLVAVSPNLWDVVIPRLSTIREATPWSPWLVTEELYTPAGSQRIILGTLYRDTLSLTLNSSLLLEVWTPQKEHHRMLPMAILDGFAGLLFSPYPGARVQDALISFPTFSRLAGDRLASVEDTPIHRVLFKFRRGVSKEDLLELETKLQNLAGRLGCSLDNIWERTDGLKIAVEAMNFFSVGTTAVALLISFFSLTSSMYANIHEQVKEVGLMRAIGVTRSTITRIYSLEAVILVMSSGFLGLGIGSLVSYTVSAQRSLVTQLPLPFDFPTLPALVLIITSLISAFFAAYLPARSMVKSNIVKLMRTV